MRCRRKRCAKLGARKAQKADRRAGKENEKRKTAESAHGNKCGAEEVEKRIGGFVMDDFIMEFST